MSGSGEELAWCLGTVLLDVRMLASLVLLRLDRTIFHSEGGAGGGAAEVATLLGLEEAAVAARLVTLQTGRLLVVAVVVTGKV